MRPPREQRSPLRYPLDDALGTSATVRLLRVLLHDVGGPVGVTDAARLAGLSPAGTRKAFSALERHHLAVRVGTGRAQKWAPVTDDALSKPLSLLFAAEQERHDELIAGLRRSVSMPEVRTAWMAAHDGLTRSVDIGLVVDARSMEWITSEVRARLREVEMQFDLSVEVDVYTRADGAAVPDDALVLWGGEEGADTETLLGVREDSDSAERSLVMSGAIAELIKTDPSLIKRALRHTDRLLREGQGTATADIGEWRQLLETYSPERLRDLLVSRSSRAERLRRSSPFFAVLDSDERDRVMRAMEARR